MTQEPPRSEPDFRVFVARGLAMIDDGLDENLVDVTHAVMDTYDIAVNSINFGSGFLSTEEVGNLRVLGAAIGAQRFDYQHDRCLRCGHEFDDHYEHYERTTVDPGEGCFMTGCSCRAFIPPEHAP